MIRFPEFKRFPFSPIRHRPKFQWPGGKTLACYIALNLEHFIFGKGGVDFDRTSPVPNLRSYLWREYGNRVGVWRILDLFDELNFPMGVIVNTAVYDHAPQIMEAHRARGDEIIGHVKILKKTKTLVFLFCELKCNNKIITSASGVWKILKVKSSNSGPGG